MFCMYKSMRLTCANNEKRCTAREQPSLSQHPKIPATSPSQARLHHTQSCCFQNSRQLYSTSGRSAPVRTGERYTRMRGCTAAGGVSTFPRVQDAFSAAWCATPRANQHVLVPTQISQCWRRNLWCRRWPARCLSRQGPRPGPGPWATPGPLPLCQVGTIVK